MDKETQEVISDQELLKQLTEHGGWGIARGLLVEKILTLQSIAGFELTDPQQLMIDIKANKLAAEILFSWLKEDIEGSVSQLEANNKLTLIDKPYIIRE